MIEYYAVMVFAFSVAFLPTLWAACINSKNFTTTMALNIILVCASQYTTGFLPSLLFTLSWTFLIIMNDEDME